MMSNDLDDTSRSNLMAAMALLQRRRRTTGVTPSQLATDSGIPAMGALPDADYQMSPSAIASMMAHRDATQAKQDKLPTLDDFAATPLLNTSDTDLVRSQYNRGGSTAAAILESKGTRPQLRGGKLDYSGVKPIKGPDDLMANAKFQSLAQDDPAAAAHVYKAMTGKDFTADYQEKMKQQLAMKTSWETSLQKGFEDGNYRRHPTMGWLERRVSIPNIDPTAPPQEFWKPVDATVHQADMDYGAKATGYVRAPTQADAVPMQYRNAFMEEFYRNTSAGKDDKTALQAAVNHVQNIDQTPAKIAMASGNTVASPPPAAVTANPAPPEDNAAYQAWATDQANKRIAATKEGVSSLGNKFFDNVVGPVLGAGGKVGDAVASMFRGQANAPNMVSTALTGKPLYPWVRPSAPTTSTGFSAVDYAKQAAMSNADLFDVSEGDRLPPVPVHPPLPEGIFDYAY